MQIDITKPPPTLAKITAEKKVLQAEAGRLKKTKRISLFALVVTVVVWFMGLAYAVRYFPDLKIVKLLFIFIAVFAIFFIFLYFFSLGCEEFRLERLREAAPSEHQKIADNMAYPEVAAYCQAVASQGRKLTVLEVNALDRWIDEANKQADIEQLYELVYGATDQNNGADQK